VATDSKVIVRVYRELEKAKRKVSKVGALEEKGKALENPTKNREGTPL